MTERHGDHLALRTAPVVSAPGSRCSTKGDDYDLAWREARNGLPEPVERIWREGEAERDEWVAEMVAAAKAEAVRRALAGGDPAVPVRRREDVGAGHGGG